MLTSIYLWACTQIANNLLDQLLLDAVVQAQLRLPWDTAAVCAAAFFGAGWGFL